MPAIRVLRRDKRGSSSPVVVETAEGSYFVKLRGSAQGTSALVAEVIVASLADRIGLPVPPRRIVVLSEAVPSDDRNDELADLLRASHGENLGFLYLPNARPFTLADLGTVTRDFAAQVRWLDWLVLNPDRGPRNPNLMVDGSALWLIDHGAALPFQHDWASVTEASPGRAELAIPHVLASLAGDVAEWDPLLTSLVGRQQLIEAVAEVPESFIRPLLTGDTVEMGIARRRESYVAFLWKRLRAPHLFGS
ncbi:MAG: HipA family kinase [Gemmatimonadota bacterium]